MLYKQKTLQKGQSTDLGRFTHINISISIYIYKLNMPFYLQMSKDTTQQRDIYDTVIFQFLQIFYRLTMKISL